MSIIYRGISIDDSYQISVHLAKRFQRRRFFRIRPIRNKHCLVAMFLTDRDEMSCRYRAPAIDASYHVPVHLAKWFQMRRLKCEKFTGDGRQVIAKAHFDFGKVSWKKALSHIKHHNFTKIWMKLQNYENYPKNYKNMNGIISFILYTFTCNTQI